MAIALRYAALSDVGLVRSSNQDSGYAGPHLLVIADGMGGHAGGDVASSLAIAELAPLDEDSHGADALEHLSTAVAAAHRVLLERVSEEPGLTGMGTTVTAMLWAGGKFALAHIGDSRAYLLREGRLIQVTRDHTFVQTLVEEGRITPDEAENHPQRSVLMRVLSDVVEDVEPDLSMREAHAGDRYLLCSDGLSGVVSHETLAEALAAGDDPAATCETLVQLALKGGAPDNVTCVVADVVDVSETDRHQAPAVVGSASTRRPERTAPASPALRAAELTRAPVDDDPVASVAPVRRVVLAVRRTLAVAAVAAVVTGGVYGAYRWSQAQFFVGTDAGMVAIYRGLPQDVGPVRLATLDEVVADVRIADLPSVSRQLVQQGISADDRGDAQGIVQELRDQAIACRSAQPLTTSPTTPTPTLTPSVTPSGTPTGTPTASASSGTSVPPTATATATGSSTATATATGSSTATSTATASTPSGASAPPSEPSTGTATQSPPAVDAPVPELCEGLG